MLPFFYQENLPAKEGAYTLDEATSKHCVQVLRMKEGAPLLLTNGKGLRIEAVITAAERKHCMVHCTKVEQLPARPVAFTLGIAFTKNNSRNEWLLEKAMEMGIEQIYPIITDRTEKDKLKMERLQGILVSAMLQSQQCYLPQLHDSIKLKDLLQQSNTTAQRFIAHCIDTEARKSYITHLQPGKDTLMLIGPEGDFTPAEISLCLDAGLEPVSLGKNRLRTETAGLYACTIFNAVNYG